MVTTRLEGWELRFVEAIERARFAPYKLGEHDCFRFACQIVLALTGVDRWPEFVGRYHDRRSAIVLIHQYGSSFEAAFDKFFGTERISVLNAHRGDIVAITDATGERHLAVCMGPYLAALKPEGLLFLPRCAAHCAWRIG
jgi:hypothetical protein